MKNGSKTGILKRKPFLLVLTLLSLYCSHSSECIIKAAPRIIILSGFLAIQEASSFSPSKRDFNVNVTSGKGSAFTYQFSKHSHASLCLLAYPRILNDFCMVMFGPTHCESLLPETSFNQLQDDSISLNMKQVLMQSNRDELSVTHQEKTFLRCSTIREHPCHFPERTACQDCLLFENSCIPV